MQLLSLAQRFLKLLQTFFRQLQNPMMRLFSNRFPSLGHRFLGCLLALSVAWLSWGNAALAATKSSVENFSDSQITQIRTARNQIATAQERLGELGDYINAQDWTYTGNFIHGPLGDLRREAATINRNLPAKEQKKARKQAKQLMSLVERIDAASKDKNVSQTAKNFAQLEDSFEGFLSLVPNFDPDTSTADELGDSGETVQDSIDAE